MGQATIVAQLPNCSNVSGSVESYHDPVKEGLGSEANTDPNEIAERQTGFGHSLDRRLLGDFLRTQRGSVPMEFVFGVAVFLFPIALLVLSIGPMVERAGFAQQVAAELARAVVVSDGDATYPLRNLASGSWGNVPPQDIRVSLCGSPWRAAASAHPRACAPLTRGGTVRVRVSVRVPLIRNPLANVGGFTFYATHDESVDAYRSRS